MNQRFTYLIIAIISVLSFSSCSPESEVLPLSISENGLYYVLLADNTYRVEGIQSNKQTHLEIPSSINGIPVSIIGKYAFQNWDIESVSIPNSIVSIGDYAFQYCEKLTSVSVPSSVKSIGSYAFSYCSALSNITLSEGLKFIGEASFYQLGNDITPPQTLTIPKTVDTIQDNAFYSFIEAIFIPKNVSYIGKASFLSKIQGTNPDFAITIYCEHDSQPEGWNSLWAWDNYGTLDTSNVIWGATYDDFISSY